MLKPEEIIKKVGKERIQNALESGSGDALKELFEEEKIELTPEQMDYIAGGVGFTLNSSRRRVDGVGGDGPIGKGGSNGGGGVYEDEEEVDTCDGSIEDEPATGSDYETA